MAKDYNKMKDVIDSAREVYKSAILEENNTLVNNLYVRLSNRMFAIERYLLAKGSNPENVDKYRKTLIEVMDKRVEVYRKSLASKVDIRVQTYISQIKMINV